MRVLSTIRDWLYGPVLPTEYEALTVDGEAVAQQRARITRVQEAWEVYAKGGRSPLRTAPGTPDDNTIVNFCRVIVDKSADFLFGKPIEFDVVGAHEAEEKWLDEVWRANQREILLHDMAVNGAVTGDVFMRVVQDPEWEHPRLINIDPGTIYALWDPDDIERVMEYRIEWVGVDPERGKSVSRRQTITRDNGTWTITDWVAYDRDTDWRMMGQEVWPYAWCPVFKAKNLPAPNEFYGTPDLTEDIIHMNDRVNFIASNTTKIIRHHAHPKTWGRGFTSREVDMAPDTVTIIHNTDGTLQNLEMHSDLQSSLNWYKYLVGGLHTIARVPEVATGRVESLGQLSGVALEILYGPIVDKTRTKRNLYGRMLNQMNQCLLEMHGVSGRRCDIRWSDPWPVDDLTQAQIGIMHHSLGVSLHTIQDILGFDYEREERLSETETPSGPVDTASNNGITDTTVTRMADIRPSRMARKTFTGTKGE